MDAQTPSPFSLGLLSFDATAGVTTITGGTLRFDGSYSSPTVSVDGSGGGVVGSLVSLNSGTTLNLAGAGAGSLALTGGISGDSSTVVNAGSSYV